MLNILAILFIFSFASFCGLLWNALTNINSSRK